MIRQEICQALHDDIRLRPRGPESALSARNETASQLRGYGGSWTDQNDQGVGETALRDAILALRPDPVAALSARNETTSQLQGC